MKKTTKLTRRPNRARRPMATKRTNKRDVVGLVFTAALALSGLAMLVMVASEARGAEIKIGHVAYKESVDGAEKRIGIALERAGWDYCLPTDEQFESFDYTDKIAIRRGSRECLSVHEVKQ